jgi:hypothetical protein
MKNVADIKDIKTFKQAAESYSKDRESLKQLKGILQDSKTEIELAIDSPFAQGPLREDGWMERAENARSWIIRKMQIVDMLLSAAKGASGAGGYLMWIVARVEGTVVFEGWKATTDYPAQWLADHLPEEEDPDNLELSHFMTLNPEQYENLDKRIERV